MTKRGIFPLMGLLLAAPLAAQDLSGLPDPLVTDRPDFTESAGTVPAGHVQVEGGYTFTRQGDEEGSSLGEVLVRIAMGGRMEARLGVGSYGRIDPGVPGAETFSGYEDPSVGIKIMLTEADPDLLPPGRPVMALLLGTSVPVGSDELTADEWQPEAKLAMAWELNDWLSLASNLIYAYPADGDERFHQYAASLSAGFSLADRWGAYLEGYGFSKESVDGSSTTYLNSGITFSISKDFQLDARIGAGLDSPHPNWFAGVGAAVRF